MWVLRGFGVFWVVFGYFRLLSYVIEGFGVDLGCFLEILVVLMGLGCLLGGFGVRFVVFLDLGFAGFAVWWFGFLVWGCLLLLAVAYTVSALDFYCCIVIFNCMGLVFLQILLKFELFPIVFWGGFRFRLAAW